MHHIQDILIKSSNKNCSSCVAKETFLKMIETRAERIGASTGIEIIESIKKDLAKENKTTISIGE
ncbi:MAG: hypothetical protein JJD95_16945 [Clostridium sp.]|nr:hypothetical protein [Clostridium sp.]